MRGGLTKALMHNFNIYVEQGMTAEEISERMKVHLDGIKPHMPKQAAPEKKAPEKEPVKKVAKKRVVKKKAVANGESD